MQNKSLDVCSGQLVEVFQRPMCMLASLVEVEVLQEPQLLEYGVGVYSTGVSSSPYHARIEQF